jgi:Polyketide cyclase / dehydrase and lipid transport
VTAQARTASVSIDRTPAEVYGYLADPATFPEWSFFTSMEPAGDGRWTAGLPDGRTALLSFSGRNELGVLDHEVRVGDATVHVPMRVVPNGGGSEVLLTAFRRPGMSDEEFAADVAAVEKDLAALKALLERRS